MTATIILLKTLISQITTELQTLYNNNSDFTTNNSRFQTINNLQQINTTQHRYIRRIHDYIRTILLPPRPEEQSIAIIKQIINICCNWEPFINIFYAFTQDINIVGIYEQDIIQFSGIINRDQLFNRIKIGLIDSIFDNGVIHDVNKYNNIQLFLALENNRYLLPNPSSFRDKANEKIISILNVEHDGIIGNVNTKLSEAFQNCPGQNYNQNIPFAFKSKSPIRRKPKSPIRRKPKSPIRRKSKSPIRRKSKSPIRRKPKSPISSKSKSKSPIRRKSK